jgi:hypothetical protein
MNIARRLVRQIVFGLVPFSIGLVGCADPSPLPPDRPHAASHATAERGLTSDELGQIAQLRALTAPFHDIEAAREAGWSSRITDCMSDPNLGGMGYHYGKNPPFDAVIDPLQPELLLYEPQKNGKLRFVAVEYAVPFDLWKSPNPPQLFGQYFHRNEDFGLWILHVWHFDDNPRGMFRDWNPRVSCAYATP